MIKCNAKDAYLTTEDCEKPVVKIYAMALRRPLFIYESRFFGRSNLYQIALCAEHQKKLEESFSKKDDTGK